MLDIIRKALNDLGYSINNEKELAHGVQLILANGALVNVFNTGKYNVQGRNAQDVKNAIDQILHKEPVAKKIFVVYGHDDGVRHQLEALLRRWGLEPVILEQLSVQGETLIEKIENYSENIGYGVVLATPDDEGHRCDHPKEKKYRARQNVVLELGILLARLGRAKIAILLKNPSIMEPPSDIDGLEYIPFEKDITREEACKKLAQALVSQGYDIDIRKL